MQLTQPVPSPSFIAGSALTGAVLQARNSLAHLVLIGAVVSGILFGLLRKLKTKPIYKVETSIPLKTHQLVMKLRISYRFRYDSKLILEDL